MDNSTTFAELGTATSTIALINSQSVASWVYVIVATVSVLLGIVTLVYNFWKSLKDDNKIDDEERESLIKQIEELKKQLDEINKNRPNNWFKRDSDVVGVNIWLA